LEAFAGTCVTLKLLRERWVRKKGERKNRNSLKVHRMWVIPHQVPGRRVCKGISWISRTLSGAFSALRGILIVFEKQQGFAISGLAFGVDTACRRRCPFQKKRWKTGTKVVHKKCLIILKPSMRGARRKGGLTPC
jgi:hypothetical protein